MVEVEVPEEAGPELALNYAGEQVTYAPIDGVVEVEEHHLAAFLGAISGSRRRVVTAEQPPIEPEVAAAPTGKSAKSSAKTAPKE